VVHTEQKPGRRRAEPAPRRLRRDQGAQDTPADDRPAKNPKPPKPPKRPTPAKPPKQQRERTPLARRLGIALWFLALAGGLAAVVLPWTSIQVPEAVPLAGAVAVTTLFTHGLAVRTGGRPVIAGGLALVASAAAVVSGSAVLLAAAAITTAVVAAVLAVLATTPAARFLVVIREVGIATAIAATGALAARAYGPEVSPERTGYLAIGLSLVGALVLVHRLGAGFHGLGRRGFVMIVSGVALLTVTLAYTEALSQWGSPGMIERIEGAYDDVRDTIGAIPRPLEVLLGFPALAWGVSTRARRRQGWWVCAFGAAGLAVVAVSLIAPPLSLREAGLSLLYSMVLGLVLGYAVVRADLFLTGARGRRARRLEELAAHRPEPGRLRPLL
jgi:hypothetical protein